MPTDWSVGSAVIGQVANKNPIYRGWTVRQWTQFVHHEYSPVIGVAISKSFRERVAGDFELRDLK